MATPLCPALYQRMQEELGDVSITHEGEEAIKGTAMTVMGKTRYYGGSEGEYYVANCPFCGDQKKRLYVNYKFAEKDQRHKAICYNDTMCLTGEAGKANRRKLYAVLVEKANIPFSFRAPDRTKIAKLPDTPPPLPGTVRLLHEMPPTHEAVRYLREQRRLDPIQLDREYGVGVVVAANPEYWRTQGRLYVPITMSGKLVGWQCRVAAELDWKKLKIPKYYNLPDMHKSLMLYGYDAAVRAQSPFVIVVEGVTDVWGVGPPSVAILGGSISDAQVGLILGTWKHVILYLDGDARTLKTNRANQPEGAKTMLEKAYDKLAPAVASMGGVLHVTSLPGELDPGKLSRAQNWDWLVNSYTNALRGHGR